MDSLLVDLGVHSFILNTNEAQLELFARRTMIIERAVVVVLYKILLGNR